MYNEWSPIGARSSMIKSWSCVWPVPHSKDLWVANTYLKALVTSLLFQGLWDGLKSTGEPIWTSKVSHSNDGDSL